MTACLRAELHQTDQHQNRGQTPKKHLSAKRQAQFAEKRPAGQHQAAAKVDRNGPAKPETDELPIPADTFPEQRHTQEEVDEAIDE